MYDEVSFNMMTHKKLKKFDKGHHRTTYINSIAACTHIYREVDKRNKALCCEKNVYKPAMRRIIQSWITSYMRVHGKFLYSYIWIKDFFLILTYKLAHRITTVFLLPIVVAGETFWRGEITFSYCICNMHVQI